MFMASVRALFETDLKKMVALSTWRQLGIMFLSLGLGRFLLRFILILEIRDKIFFSKGTDLYSKSAATAPKIWVVKKK